MAFKPYDGPVIDEEEAAPRLVPYTGEFIPDAPTSGVPSRGATRAVADTGLGVAQGGLNIVSGGMRLVDLAARFNPGGPAGLVFYRALLNNGGDVGAALKQTKDVVLAPESALSYSAGNIDRSSGMLQTLKSESLQRTAQESNERIERQGGERDTDYVASLPADDRAALEAARAGGPLDAAGTYIRRPGLALGALKSVAGEAKDQAVELAQNPSLAVDFAAQQVPQFLATGGAVKLATRGLAGEAAVKAGQRAALGAGSGLEAGGAAQQAAQQFEQMPDEKLLTLPRTKELLDQGLTLDEIRGLYGRQAGAVAAPLAGLSSVGFNKLTGASKLESSIFGAGEEPARRTLGQTARRGLAATGIEGAQGGAEEGASQLATNVGASTVDPQQRLSEGVGSNIALGALMEGPMGGAGRVARDVADNLQAKRSDAAGEFEAAAKRFSTAQDPDSGNDVLVTPSGVVLGSPDEAQAAWQKASPEERETWMQPLESPPPSGDSAIENPEDAEIERVRALREKLPPKGQVIIDRRVAMLVKKRDERLKMERAKADAEQLRESAQIAADAGDFDSRRELLKEADRLAPPATQVDGIEVGEEPAEVTLADPDVDPQRPPTTAGIEVGTVPEITLKDGRPAPDEELPSTEGLEVTTPEVDAAQSALVSGEEPSPVDELRRLIAKTDDPDVQAALATEIRAQERQAKAKAAAQQKSSAQARAAEGLKKLVMSTENESVRSLLLARAEKLQAPASEPDPFAPSPAAAASPNSAKAPRTSADMAERSRKALLAEIRQMGGIDQGEMPDIVGEGRRNSAGGVATRVGGQVRSLFTKNGVGLDRVRERMAEMGYFTDDGDVTGDLGTVREVVRAALDGDGAATLTPGERGDYEAMRIAEKTAADEVAAELELSQTERERALLQHQADELLTDDERSTLAERYQDDDEYFQRLQEAVNAKRESDEDREGRQADPAAGGREDGGAPRVEAAARVEDAAEKPEGYVTPRPEPGSGLSQRNPEASKVSNFRLSLPPTQAMPRDQVEATVANILKRWKNAPPITVVDSMTAREVPAEVRRDYVQQVKNGARGAPRAFYHRKKAYLVADQLNSPRAATEALFHEVLGHYGLRETFGQELRPVLEAVAKYRKADVDAKVESYGLDPSSSIDRLRAAEEVLAELAQTRPQLIIVRRAFAIIRSFLRKLGLNFNYSDDELIRNFIEPARQFVERGVTREPAEPRVPGAGAQPAFSVTDGWIEKANRRMAKLVDEWLAGKVRPTDTLVLGDTPPVLRALGVPQAPVEVIATTLIKTQEGKHKDFGITPPMLKELPTQIYDPPAIFDSEDALGLVLVTELRDRLGNPVIAALHVGRQSGRSVVNRVASVYSKEEAGKRFTEWAKAGRLRYLRNEESLGPSTTIPRSVVGEVVQAARDSRSQFKTAADVSQLSGRISGDGISRNNPSESRAPLGLRGNSSPVSGQSGDPGVSADSRRAGEADAARADDLAPTRDGDDPTAFSLAGKRQPNPARQNPPSAFNDETRTEAFVRRLADKMNRVLKGQAIAETAGAKITDEKNVYVRENVSYGKADHMGDQLEKKHFEPILADMKAAKLTLQQVDDYLYAMHAPERNAVIAARNPTFPDGGSGMSNAQAARTLAAFTPAQRVALDKIGAKVRAMQAAKLDMMEKYGVLSKADVQQLASAYKHYVPLKSVEEDSDQFGIGQGFDVRGNEVQMAMGRGTRATSPLMVSFQDFSRAIIRSVKNDVGRALYNLASDPAAAGVVELADPADFTIRTTDKNGQVKTAVDPNYARRDEIFATKVNGETKYIHVKDPLMLQQLKKLGDQQVPEFLNGWREATALFGRLVTQYNPAFGPVNALRDALQASVFAMSQPGIGGAKVLRDIPWAMSGIVGKSPTWSKLYDEFIEDGGGTGAYGLKSLRDLQSLIEAEGLAMGGQAAPTAKQFAAFGRRAAAKLGRTWAARALAGYNDAFENATRLSVYANARRAGRSRQEAAFLSKEISTNFNKKGEWSPVLNAAFAFFNAAVQGNRALLKFAKHPVVKGAIVTLLVAGFLNDMLGSALGGDDDDTGEKNIDEVNEFKRDHAVVMPVDDKHQLMLPLPYGLNVPFMIGRRVSNAMRTGNYGSNMVGILSGIIDNFSPIGAPEPANNAAGSVAKVLTPTLLKPVTDLATNTNFYGGPIYKQVGQFDKSPSPRSEDAFRSTTDISKAISKAINQATGGDRIKPGAVDIPPEVMDYVAAYYGGGVGRTALQLWGAGEKLVAGESDEIDPNKLPLLNRFYGNDSRGTSIRRYREIQVEMEYAKDYAKQGQGDKITAQQRKVFQTYTSAEKLLAQVRKARKAAFQAGDDDRVKKLDETEQNLQEQVIKRWNASAPRETAALAQ